MRRVMPVTGAVAVLLATAPCVFAQVSSSQDSARTPWPTVTRDPGFGTNAADTSSIRQVIRGNFREVALGRLGESRASNSEVKEFAKRMVSDHNDMNDKWSELARNNKMKIDVADIRQAGDASTERLQDLSGTAFDQAYMGEMIRQHEQDLATLQRIGSSAGSSELRALATAGATSTREHFTLAQQVGGRIGISTTAARTSTVTNPAPRSPLPTPYDTARRRTTDDRTASDERDDRDNRDNRDNRGSLRREDRAFVQQLLADHLLDVRLAKRAQRETRSNDTRQFAERIEKDFTAWAERWEKFADRRDAEVTSHLERTHREKLERLDKASERKDFDRAYTAIMVDHLDAVEKDFRQEASEKRSPAVRRLIEQELPVIREHLAHARRLEKQASDKEKGSDKK